MGSSLAKNDIHLVFHIKYCSMEIRDKDLGQVFAYIGGVIRNMDGIPVHWFYFNDFSKNVQKT